MLSVIALTVLAALALGAPTSGVQHGTTPAYIKWINDYDLTACGPWGGLQNGQQPWLWDGNSTHSSYHRNCRVDWKFVTGGVPTTIETTSWNAAGTRFCLDAGLNPGNGVKPHVWECIDGAPQQTWSVHPPGKIELYGKGLCLDVPDGQLVPNGPMQLYQCYEGNMNQLWHFPSV